MLFKSTMALTLIQALARFGLAEFRPGQREIIESVLDGKPTIAVLPTGAGKSLCFQLPAVALEGLAIVVSPLISLMKDQVDALEQRGIPAAFINSSISADERHERLRRAVSGELRLLYVAPERFRAPNFAASLARAKPTLFAVDEAHCMVEWGHDFRPDYARLGEIHRELGAPRLVALTATATPDVRASIGRQLGMQSPSVFVRGFDRANLRLEVMPVQGGDDKLRRCLHLLDEPPARGQPAIVYAATRKKAEQVAQNLRRARIKARAYHAGLADVERAEVQERWMANDVRVVVATNAFGMGVDKRDVRLVIHHELPGSAEAYYQEAGRAGRDGEPARCVLLFNHSDVRLREFLITSAGDNGPRPAAVIEAEHDRLRAMMSYAYARSCRRAFLLDYFGDETHRCADRAEQPCDNCRAIGGDAEISDEEQLLVRKVLSCIARVDGRFGRKRIALCLEGSDAQDVTDAGLDRLSTYGVLRGRPHAWVMDLLGTLEAADLVVSDGDDYPCIGLTPRGREVMHDRARMPAALPRERKAAKTPRSQPLETDDLPVDEALFARLRALRSRLASDEKLPAYCIFHDRTLVALARARPSTIDQLDLVPGVGPTKKAKYGAAVLAALQDVRHDGAVLEEPDPRGPD
jgi:ATP-dependent DNA helicase RecQ